MGGGGVRIIVYLAAGLSGTRNCRPNKCSSSGRFSFSFAFQSQVEAKYFSILLFSIE